MSHFGTDRTRTCYLRSSERQFGRSFLEVFPFTEGKGAVRDRSGAYYIGSEGRPCYREKYRRAYPFQDGKAAVEDDLGMFHIGPDGNQLYRKRYAWVSDFHEGLCAVRLRNGRWTFITSDGEPCGTEFSYCSDLSCGTAVVADPEGFFHIDASMRPLYDERYVLCRGFDGGLAPVFDGRKWHLIGREGQRLSEDMDDIYAGRNGLVSAIKGDDLGLFRKDLSFMRLSSLTERPDPYKMPEWTDDILRMDWDSCVVFMRHSERASHYLCDDKSISRTDLTNGGIAFARSIGTKLSVLADRRIYARCSPAQRCITTANSIMGAMGVPAEVETRREIGPGGTAFFREGDYTEEELERPSSIWCMDQLMEGPVKGWYSNEEICGHVLDMVKGFLEEDRSLTFCVNHDLYVIPVVAYMTGRFPRDGWLEYCDGLLFLRKGDVYTAVWKGKEYPAETKVPMDIDVSGSPTSITMDRLGKEVGKTWDWEPREDIAWENEGQGGYYTGCDMHGRFFLGRDDRYLATNRKFTFAGDFSEQCVPIQLERKGATYVTDFGDYLHNRWFIECREFGEGIAPVRDADGWHYADTDGRFVDGTVFGLCEPVFHGESLVMKDGRPFVRMRDGKLLGLMS